MRGIGGLLYETSKLDAIEGIRYRGHSLYEICELCPSCNDGGQPIPEAVLWLLLTGEYPHEEELNAFVKEVNQRGQIPKRVEDMINNLPKEMHPMTQFSVGMMALQPDSVFANAYRNGIHKSKYWEPTFEDAIDVVAKTKRVAALIYHNLYMEGPTPDSNPDLDFAADFGTMMGYEDTEIHALLRLYLTVHMDHEGGNVSAHTNRLVGSALSDPYLSFSACLNGLAGPLHGLANQECLRWLLSIKEKYGDNWNRELVAQHVWDTLNSGNVVPGYGHAVLRNTDPRFTLQLKFAEQHFGDDNLVKLVRTCYETVPGELKKTGKVANPFPNVDAASGSLLMHFGINQFDYYTVLFGVARAYGVMAAQVWDRALGLPIERPGSTTLELLIERANDLASRK